MQNAKELIEFIDSNCNSLEEFTSSLNREGCIGYLKFFKVDIQTGCILSIYDLRSIVYNAVTTYKKKET